MIIKMKNNGAPVPFYATKGAAGFDICSNEDDFFLSPSKRLLISTGLFLQIPYGFEMQIRPRSGFALKDGITVLNSPATIDSDYRGEIGVLLINHGEQTALIKKGDRIAQGVVSPVAQAKFVLVDALNETERGSGGFGSTGV